MAAGPALTMTLRRRCGVTVLAGGCLLIVLGGASLLRPGPPREVGSVAPLASGGASAAVSGRVPAADDVGAARLADLRGGGRAPLAVPVVLALTRLGVKAAVIAVTVGPGGGLDVPPDPHTVGWWRSGAGPGAGRGSVVIDGHVDDRRLGEGALFALRESRPGDAVALRDQSGRWWRYVVTGLRRYAKGRLPADLVFGPGGRERLVLITCGGAFDRRTHQYADNLVVYAVPVGR